MRTCAPRSFTGASRPIFVPLLAGLVALLASGPGAGLAEDRWVEAGRDWWAFRPLERPPVPPIGAGCSPVRNPIDAFHQAALAEFDQAPAPEADRATLVRRLTLDLTGLPPTPGEVDAFLADEAPDAYERLADRLLATPGHGERWGRHWLDLARYADSDGYEHDARRPNAWRYRDWVVEALNADLPYDRFLRLQLAADEAAPAEPRHRAALGFLRGGPRVANQVNDATRADELDDIVAATTSTFLGLTVACARCHDHKADPIPQADYARLVAVFAPAQFEDVSMSSAEEVARHRDQAAAVESDLSRLRAEIRAADRAPRERVEAAQLARLAPEVREALDTGRINDLTDAQRDALARALDVTDEAVEGGRADAERATLADLRRRLAEAEARRPTEPPAAMGVVEDRSRAITGVEAGPPRAVAGRLAQFDDLPPAAATTGRRAALADWMIHGATPLVARVAVNRLWLGHFGRGLVETPSDFGASGVPPTHPELLDWLSAELVESGWSLKAIHRLVVTSGAYRQSSRPRPELAAIDPDDALLGRFPGRRLEAEAIRDSILACADTLNPAIGGPGVFPPIDPGVVRSGDEPRWPLDAAEGPEVWRRSLYVYRLRSIPLPLLDVFDLPAGVEPCPRRDRTTTPTQALSLLNSPFVLEQADHFAARVAREAGPDVEDRLALAHRIATGQPPDPDRRAILREFLDRQAAAHRSEGEGSPEVAALADLCHVLLLGNAFLSLD